MKTGQALHSNVAFSCVICTSQPLTEKRRQRLSSLHCSLPGRHSTARDMCSALRALPSVNLILKSVGHSEMEANDDIIGRTASVNSWQIKLTYKYTHENDLAGHEFLVNLRRFDFQSAEICPGT